MSNENQADRPGSAHGQMIDEGPSSIVKERQNNLDEAFKYVKLAIIIKNWWK